MRSHPLPHLAFDHVGAEQLEWDAATDEITFAAPVGQTFRCAHDALHRIEVFIEPDFHFKRSHLWLVVFEGESAGSPAMSRPARLAGPLATEALVAHGWFSFEFEPIAPSAGKTYSFFLHAPDATPRNALSVRMSRRAALRGLSVAGRPRSGAVTFRALCLRAPALYENFLRFRTHAEHRTTTAEHRPLMARLEISRPCNLHCIMCQRGLHPFDAAREAPGFMSLETVRALDPVLPTLLRVLGFGLGEPFLNPQYLSILRHLRAHNPWAYIFTSTNGTRLGDETIAALLDEGLLSELQISLDGNERETFEAIRKNASFAAVTGAFERLVAARAQRGTRSLSVIGAMLVMKLNVTQVLAFARRMLALGVDRVSLDSPKDATFQPLRADSDDEMERILEQVAAASDLLSGTGTELSGPLLSELGAWHRRRGRPGELPRLGADECAQLSRPSPAQTAACPVPWETVSLLADGHLHVCCNSYRRLGHVRQASVAETWCKGTGYAGLRHELLSRTLHHDCRTCLGENFVLPGEVTPVTYLKGCSGGAERSAWLARQIDQRLGAFTNFAPDLRAGIDSPDWPTTGRISGWLESTANRDLGKPLLLALAIDGIVRTITSTVAVSSSRAQWSAVVDVPSAHPQLDLVALDEPNALRVQIQPSGPAVLTATGPLHGFIDEIKTTVGFVHLIGWARDRSTAAPARRVMLALAGKPLGSIQPWLPRPDVARAFGDSAENFGYTLTLPLATLAHNSATGLMALACDAAGRSAPLEWSEAAAAALATLATLTASPAPRRPAIDALRIFRRRFKTVRAAARHPVSADQGC